MKFSEVLQQLNETKIRWVINGAYRLVEPTDLFLTPDNKWTKNINKAKFFDNVTQSLDYGKEVFGDKLTDIKKHNDEYFSAKLKTNTVNMTLQFTDEDSWDKPTPEQEEELED